MAYFLNVTQTKKQQGTGFTSLITFTYQKPKKKQQQKNPTKLNDNVIVSILKLKKKYL